MDMVAKSIIPMKSAAAGAFAKLSIEAWSPPARAQGKEAAQPVSAAPVLWDRNPGCLLTCSAYARASIGRKSEIFTRSLALTSEGQAILPAARDMVAAANQAFDLLTENVDQSAGALRSIPPAFGERSPLLQSIPRFIRAHPMVALSIYTSDYPVDLAVGRGVLRDSAVKSKRIGSLRSRRSTTCDMAMLPDAITLSRGDETFQFTSENVRLEVHSLFYTKSSVLEGFGIQHLPDSEVGAEIAAGTKAEVPPDWSLPILGIYTVWSDIGPQKKLTRRLLDCMQNEQKNFNN